MYPSCSFWMYEKKVSSKVCREHHPQYQHWQEVHREPVERELDLILPPSVTTSALQGRQFVTTSRTMSPSTNWVTTLFSHQIVFTKDTTIVTLTWCTSQLNYLQGQPLALLVINWRDRTPTAGLHSKQLKQWNSRCAKQWFIAELEYYLLPWTFWAMQELWWTSW